MDVLGTQQNVLDLWMSLYYDAQWNIFLIHASDDDALDFMQSLNWSML